METNLLRRRPVRTRSALVPLGSTVWDPETCELVRLGALTEDREVVELRPSR